MVFRIDDFSNTSSYQTLESAKREVAFASAACIHKPRMPGPAAKSQTQPHLSNQRSHKDTRNSPVIARWQLAPKCCVVGTRCPHAISPSLAENDPDFEAKLGRAHGGVAEKQERVFS